MPKKLVSIEDFRDQWLDDFFMYSAPHKKIPPDYTFSIGP